MRTVGRLLGYMSILVNLGLALFLVGLGLVGALEGSDLSIDLIPIAPESMATTLILSGLGALVAIVLALRSGRAARFLLVLWSLLVSGLLLSAFFRPAYRFDGMEDFRAGVWIFLGSLVLLAGSFFRWKITPEKKATAKAPPVPPAAAAPPEPTPPEPASPLEQAPEEPSDEKAPEKQP